MTEEQAAQLIDLLREMTATDPSSMFTIPQITAIAATLVAVVALLWSIYSFKRQQRTDRLRRKTEMTLSIAMEWDSPEMLERRILVENYLRNSAPKNLSTHYDDLPFVRPEGDKEAVGWIDLSHILHFLEKVGLLVGQEEFDAELYRSLFGAEFIFWHTRLAPLAEKETEAWSVLIQTGQIATKAAIEKAAETA